MKKPGFGQTIGILANVGVIAGIIFLGVELQQNNQLLRAQAQMQLADNRESANEDIYRNEDIARILVKVERGEPLDDVERMRLTRMWGNSFNKWRSEWAQWNAGLLTEEDLPPGTWYRALRVNPGMLEVWEARKSRFPKDFVEWVERPGADIE